jgi:hypothetical protein
MGFPGRSRFASVLIAATLIFVVQTSRADDSVDAAIIASGMKAKMKLPVHVDDDTRLDDVRAISKKELGYFLTLTRMTKRLESGIRGGACQNPSYLKLFKAGLSLRMTYASSDKVEVKTIVLVPKECGL